MKNKDKMMWTPWSQDHATSNQDWVMILENQNKSNMSDTKNLPKGTNTIGMNKMTSPNQLIFYKSDSVRSRT